MICRLCSLLLVWLACCASAVKPAVNELSFLSSWDNGARLVSLTNVSLDSAVGAASMAFEAAATDAELGSDFLVVAHNDGNDNAGGGSGGGLKGYCSGDDGTMKEDMRVEADWKNYGTFYPGKVKDVNKDGSYDVKYDDGFSEKKIIDKNIKPVDEPEKKPPKDDPACQVLDGLEKIKKVVKKANNDVSAWLANQRAKRSGKQPEVTPPPLHVEAQPVEAQPVPAPAPAPAIDVVSDDPKKNAKLEELKVRLAAKDEEIRQLEIDVSANDDEIRAAMSGDGDKTVRSIDDLIGEYESSIARRQDWIDFLKSKKQQQTNQLTSLGHSSVTLDDIDDTVAEIQLDVNQVQKTRDELKKTGKLDPELESAINNIVTQVGKLREKLNVLIMADKKAQQQKKLANERAAKGEAVSDADKDAAVKAAEAADDEVLKAAEGVDDELRAVDDGTKKLDSGVIPHGDKWWRYRYEHSFVEAVLMIFVLFLMVFWERFFHFLRTEAFKRSDMDDFNRMEHSTMYMSWLEFFTGELMVCLLVFLTVWLLGKLEILHYFSVVLKESEDMHLPHNGSEYTHLAIDICVVLFWAICIYFVLALSIVHAATQKLKDWAELENQVGEDDGSLSFRVSRILNIASTPAEWAELKRFMNWHISTDPEMRAALLEDAEDAGTDFQFWTYLRANVRAGTDVFFQFGVIPWSLLICTFVVFSFLHYYMHMGYIRIMSFFLVLLAVQLVGLVWIVKDVKDVLQTARGSRETTREFSQQSIHTRINTEKIFALTCFYNLFILCYGISRIVCQPWMWELHFWVVANLAAVTVAMVIFFCIVIAPMFPVFLAVMALPPYIDPDNVEMMKRCMNKTEVSSSGFLKRTRTGTF